MEFIQSTRSKDQISTAAIDAFMSRFFFRKEYGQHEIVTDRERQLKGIDVIVGNMNIDCKAMSAPGYINNPVPTFAQEIWSYSSNTNCYYEGWFINQSLETTHYMYIWIPEADVPKGGYITDSRQIKRLEVMIVDSTALHNMIYGYANRERIRDYGWRMIERKINEKVVLPEFSSLRGLAPWFRRSGQLQEGPVNLIIPKKLLQNCAVRHCMVTAQGVTDLI